MFSSRGFQPSRWPSRRSKACPTLASITPIILAGDGDRGEITSGVRDELDVGVQIQCRYCPLSLALNAASGALVWAVKAAEAKQGETFTMAPLLFEDLVLIGPAGSENGISGWVGAFRLRDGSPVRKFQVALCFIKNLNTARACAPLFNP